MTTPTLSWDGYAATWAGLHGGLDPRQASPSVRRWLRVSYLLGRGISRTGVQPLAVTVFGLVLAALTPVVVRWGPGWPLLIAAGLVLASVTADSVDGAVAMVTGKISRLGYIYDSVADRLTELCWAAAFWLVGAPGPLVGACVGVAWLYEYVAAQAAAAELDHTPPGAAGERPARIALVVAGLLLAGSTGLLMPELAAGTATLAMTAWAVVGLYGLGQLLGALRLAAR